MAVADLSNSASSGHGSLLCEGLGRVSRQLDPATEPLRLAGKRVDVLHHDFQLTVPRRLGGPHQILYDRPLVERRGADQAWVRLATEDVVLTHLLSHICLVAPRRD